MIYIYVAVNIYVHVSFVVIVEVDLRKVVSLLRGLELWSKGAFGEKTKLGSTFKIRYALSIPLIFFFNICLLNLICLPIETLVCWWLQTQDIG